MRTILWFSLALIALPTVAAQVGLPNDIDLIYGEELLKEADAALENAPMLHDLVTPEPEAEEGAAPPEKSPKDGTFADRVATAFNDEILMWGVGSAATVLVSLGGFAAVTRYISPKEALKNPQRSMLYGFVRGNPGAHLKQLSDEFGMKTSSILWHIRKLESAELVKGERVGGYRVFYAVEGGIEIRRVSRALTAIQNENARAIFAHVQRHPGATTRLVSDSLNLHGGTARWHLRRLREHGLVDELMQESGSRFYNTPLGDRALQTVEGTTVTTAPKATPVPE